LGAGRPDVYIGALAKMRTIAISKGFTDGDRTGILDTHPNLNQRIEKINRDFAKRSNTKEQLNNDQQEIGTYNKAIELNSENGETYFGRATAYSKLFGPDNYRKALNDYQKAARLGHEKAQEYLRQKGLAW
jgi:tetratricopeptide (TPR) repeat protein